MYRDHRHLYEVLNVGYTLYLEHSKDQLTYRHCSEAE